MDPTKNFDHLDPKLKDTYARVMGNSTGTTGDTAQDATVQPVVTDPSLGPNPVATPPQDVTSQQQDQFNSAPLDQPLSSVQNLNTGPNPGTGPTINAIPTDTTTMFPPEAAANPVDPAQNTSGLTNSSFFSNPSPATTDPAQNPVTTEADTNLSTPFTPATEPAPAPVTPYSPDSQTQYAPPTEQTEQMAQPLPSPSSVAQSAPKQTSALLRVLYIIAAVIFFAIYTVFWIKVFNLPFLF